MKNISLKLEPISSGLFSDFGQIIHETRVDEFVSINRGYTKKFATDTVIDTDEEGGKPIISIYETQPIGLPFRLREMERHPLSSQTFIKIDPNPSIAIVCKSGEFERLTSSGVVANRTEFEIDDLKAFLVGPKQSISFGKGTWHHFNLCLDAPTRFIVIEREGQGLNCDEFHIPDDVAITIEH